MEIEGTVELRIPGHLEIFGGLDIVADRLAGKLLHLDVVELAEVAEPLDDLRCVVTVELDVWEMLA